MTTTAELLRQDLLTPTMIAAVGVCAILVTAGIGAALRGPWLDEFWTLELSDASRGLPALIRDGWMRDAHPPVFNAGRPCWPRSASPRSPPDAWSSNLLAAGLMILAAFRLSRRTPGQAGFAAALLLLTLSLPQAMESFTHYRSYFWQMTAIATLALVARHVAATKADLDWRRDLDLAAITVLATAASIGLHYVGALFGGLLASAIAVCAFARGLRRWAALTLATTALSSLFVLASVAVQAPNWAVEFDHTWIDLPGLAALGVLVSLAVAPLWLNPVSLAGLWWRRGQGTRDSSQIWFFAMIRRCAGRGHGHRARRPCCPADRGRSLSLRRPGAGDCAAGGAGGAARAGSMAVRPAGAGGRGRRGSADDRDRRQAAVARECPHHRHHRRRLPDDPGLRRQRLGAGPAAETRTARREDPIFERAYRSLAEPWGYPVDFIGQLGGQNGSAHATPGACPVLLWYEHTPNEAENDLPWAIEAAGFTGLERARLSVTRSATGFVLRADRPEGHEVSQLP